MQVPNALSDLLKPCNEGVRLLLRTHEDDTPDVKRYVPPAALCMGKKNTKQRSPAPRLRGRGCPNALVTGIVSFPLNKGGRSCAKPHVRKFPSSPTLSITAAWVVRESNYSPKCYNGVRHTSKLHQSSPGLVLQVRVSFFLSSKPF